MSSDYGDYLKELLAPFEQERERLNERRNEYQRHLDGINSEIKRVEAVLKAGGLIEAPPKRERRTNETRIGDEKLDAITEHLRAEHPNGDGFSAREIMAEMQISSYTMYPALNLLADRGVIRLDHIGKGGKKTFKLVEA